MPMLLRPLSAKPSKSAFIFIAEIYAFDSIKGGDYWKCRGFPLSHGDQRGPAGATTS
jgi:hypothetical protein